jgi:hypothetical protein
MPDDIDKEFKACVTAATDSGFKPQHAKDFCAAEMNDILASRFSHEVAADQAATEKAEQAAKVSKDPIGALIQNLMKN